MHFTKIDLRAPTYAIRGDGDLYFNQNLNMTINAGPLERIQSGLGTVGDILGAVSSSLARYHVTGTIAAPVVKVQLLGGIGDLIDPPH